MIEADAANAHETAQLLEDGFARRCSIDWATDPADAFPSDGSNHYDLYLVCEGSAIEDAVKLVDTAIQSGCKRPIVILGAEANEERELAAIAAGAADRIPRQRLSPALLARTLRSALARQENLNLARREIELLTAEKDRLNTLRDANHRFVENACHDFRTPLTVIKEFSSIIADGLAGDVSAEQSEFLQIVLDRVDTLSHMVDAILDASRLESDLIGLWREVTDVGELMGKLRPAFEQRAAAGNAQLSVSVARPLPKVFCDADSVGRIIENLLTNACKFAGSDAKIMLWARADTARKAVTIGVTDDGPGIEAADIDTMFERFRQCNPGTKSGFGLGLHIASELVRLNFGTLAVESEPDKGATFAFTLPVFDIHALLPRHFGFLRTSRHDFRKVSIAVAAADPDGGADLAEAARSLGRQLRSYDLMLPLSPGRWLLCIACTDEELAKFVDRIVRAYGDASRNRPAAALPDIRIRAIGTFPLTGKADALGEAIRGAVRPALPASVAHAGAGD